MTTDLRNIREITTQRGVCSLIRLATICSTNDYAFGLLRQQDALSEIIVVADQQTMGKGQMGRTWHSSPGKNLNLSYITKNITSAPTLFNMAVALGVLDMITKFPLQKGISSTNFHIKWPNDIVFSKNSKVSKIAGILIENSWRGETQTASIVGVGVNIDTVFSKEKLAGFNLIPGNLNSYLAHKISARDLELPTINSIQNRIHQLSLERGEETILEAFNGALFGRDEKRMYTIDKKVFNGTFLGVEKDGRGLFTSDTQENKRVQSSNVVWSFQKGV